MNQARAALPLPYPTQFMQPSQSTLARPIACFPFKAKRLLARDSGIVNPALDLGRDRVATVATRSLRGTRSHLTSGRASGRRGTLTG